MDEPNQTSDELSRSNTEPVKKPDPGTRVSGLIALVLAVVFAGGIILWQNASESTQYKLIGEELPELVIGADTPALGRFGQFDLPARMFIRGHKLLMEQPSNYSTMVMEQFVLAHTPEDQIRAIIMSGEYEGSEAALNRVETLKLEIRSTLTSDIGQEKIEEDSYEAIRNRLLLAELDTLKSIYTKGPNSIEQPMRDQLVARYGVLGQAALTHGLENDDPLREPIVTGFIPIALLLLFVFTVAGLSFLAGLVLLIIGIINLATGKMRLRFQAPAPGGSVFLETYTVFLAAFGVLSIGLFVLSVKISPALGALAIPLQWILIVVPAWALLRGMKSKDWSKAIGLHRGEGILKEIGCGFLVYLASIPVYMVGVAITMIVILIQSLLASGSGEELEPMSNPIFDIISDGGPLFVLLIFSLATIWAPIAEELIFRGALFRHMSARMHWVLAAFLSAMLFAYMHSYGPFMVAPLIALGFMFAFMRQWRGSIIAPMTAHFIHNTALMLFMITFINLLKDPTI
ncbi:MAG: CPBP family intramembrane metalloprotease [Phycisphaerales bacterium]|nr:CPBP family intramembrane metalloprotease [Phycisphaerales bacterium]